MQVQAILPVFLDLSEAVRHCVGTSVVLLVSDGKHNCS